MNPLSFFNLLCLVFGGFFTLFFIIKFFQRGRASLWTVLLTLLVLTWGIYNAGGVRI